MFVETNQIRLHVIDHPGADPPLVLMPGLTANAHSFDGLIKAGLSSLMRVLAVDLRGRGLSDKPDRGYAMADHGADLIGLLDALDLDRVVIGGHSFGGLLSMYMAARFPERVEKVVVIDAAASMHPRARELIQPSIERLDVVLPSWEAYLEAMRRMPFFQGWWDPTIESFCRADVDMLGDGTVKARARREAMVEAVGEALAENWSAHLAAIRQPLLMLNAPGPAGPPGSPALLPREQAWATVRAVPHGSYVEIPGNHWTMLYGAGARRMVEAIRAFATGSPTSPKPLPADGVAEA